MQFPKIPSAPSAASATMDSGSDQPSQRPAGDHDNSPPIVGPCPIGQVLSQPPTMLTVLTQTPAFVSTNRSESYGPCGWAHPTPLSVFSRAWPDRPRRLDLGVQRKLGLRAIKTRAPGRRQGVIVENVIQAQSGGRGDCPFNRSKLRTAAFEVAHSPGPGPTFHSRNMKPSHWQMDLGSRSTVGLKVSQFHRVKIEIDISVAGQRSTYVFNCIHSGQATVIQSLGMR
jgi:hypothetical protein